MLSCGVINEEDDRRPSHRRVVEPFQCAGTQECGDPVTGINQKADVKVLFPQSAHNKEFRAPGARRNFADELEREHLAKDRLSFNAGEPKFVAVL
jgi:hypothetical protein